ncbi:nitroreductase [hot springs metagenome]|uniref:Nitroreductase n=1 Tax=hot springs metagenome TaxID=433727 RepID=A0A5J4L225_9ZZZZ
MDALECIKTRMSIRKFKPEPVSKEILMSVFDTARWSPSYKNTQPWEAVIVSGSKKDELSKHLIEVFERGEKPRPDIPEPQSWPSHIDIRIKELFKKRSERFGIDFSDPEVGKRSKIANFRFYGAPHGIFLFQDASLSLWSLFDIGLFTQSLMLAAHSYGLGTVPQAFLTDYSDVVKKFLGIPESKRLVLGISIGYPDVEDKANSFRTDRVDVNEIVKWIQ